MKYYHICQHKLNNYIIISGVARRVARGFWKPPLKKKERSKQQKSQKLYNSIYKHYTG